MNLLCLGKEVEVQEMQGRLLHVWAGFRSRQGFLGRDRFLLVLCGDKGSLCRDMDLMVGAVARSRQCFASLL